MSWRAAWKTLVTVGARQQREQRLEVDAGRQGVDGRGLVGAGDLHQAELGIVGLVAHELGVHGDVLGLGQALAQPGQLGAVGDDGHFALHYRDSDGRRKRAPLRKMFHVKHRSARGLKTRFCKTTPCIKKSPFLFNRLSWRRFSTSSETLQSTAEACRRPGDRCPSARGAREVDVVQHRRWAGRRSAERSADQYFYAFRD